jgi:hypothetical protein
MRRCTILKRRKPRCGGGTARSKIIGGEQVLQAANKVANRVRDIASAEGSMIGSPTEETLSRNAAVHADAGAAFATFTARVREEIGVAPPARA